MSARLRRSRTSAAPRSCSSRSRDPALRARAKSASATAPSASTSSTSTSAPALYTAAAAVRRRAMKAPASSSPSGEGVTDFQRRRPRRLCRARRRLCRGTAAARRPRGAAARRYRLRDRRRADPQGRHRLLPAVRDPQVAGRRDHPRPRRRRRRRLDPDAMGRVRSAPASSAPPAATKRSPRPRRIGCRRRDQLQHRGLRRQGRQGRTGRAGASMSSMTASARPPSSPRSIASAARPDGQLRQCLGRTSPSPTSTVLAQQGLALRHPPDLGRLPRHHRSNSAPRWRRPSRRRCTGKFTIAINQRLPLAEAQAAHRALEARETTGASLLIP